MSIVRPLEERDLDNVTALYNSIFLGKRAASFVAIRNYLREFYLDGPFREADIPSLVHVAKCGRVSGFIGVHSVPYLIDDGSSETGVRKARAAYCGALMTEQQGRDPLAGARLLKGFLGGPQDLSLSETASTVSQAMWEKLRGEVISEQSLEWFRILRPASFAVAAGSLRLPCVSVFGPLAGFTDGLLQRRRKISGLTGFLPEPMKTNVLTEEGKLEAFADIVRQVSGEFMARPDWSNGYLEHVLDTAIDKPLFGEPVIGVVRRKNGDLIGGFMYHLRRGGIARVLQIASTATNYGLVLDQLFDDAFKRGAAGIRGRSNPSLLKAAHRRSMLFATVSASVIHAKDPKLTQLFLNGHSFMNGLAGETWNRFFGGSIA